MPLCKYSFLIAGTGSGSGKTTITLGLISTLKNKGYAIAPFKCGPDYIDTGFHSIAAGVPAHNLDRWMMGEEGLKDSFSRWSKEKDVSIVEGVMGLFDGMSVESDFGSSADIAAVLNLPIILVINARGMARSLAAMVKGYCLFSKKINIVGVIANNVGSEYHAEMLSNVLEKENLPRLVGWVKRDEKLSLPERHLGLVPAIEQQESNDIIKNCSEFINETVDLELLLKKTKKHNYINTRPIYKNDLNRTNESFIVAVAKDEAFSFYYDDNLFMLKNAGATIVYFSPLNDDKIPHNTNLIYIGGGFPEVFADKLSQNISMKESLKKYADNDGAIYAECGGMMYLGDVISLKNEETYKMCGILPIRSKMRGQLKRLGYREVVLLEDCFLGEEGTIFRGHEFHYSETEELKPIKNIFNAKHPIKGEVDTKGYLLNNVFASYCHIHFVYDPQFGFKLIDRLKKAE